MACQGGDGSQPFDIAHAQDSQSSSSMSVSDLLRDMSAPSQSIGTCKAPLDLLKHDQAVFKQPALSKSVASCKGPSCDIWVSWPKSSRRKCPPSSGSSNCRKDGAVKQQWWSTVEGIMETPPSSSSEADDGSGALFMDGLSFNIGSQNTLLSQPVAKRAVNTERGCTIIDEQQKLDKHGQQISPGKDGSESVLHDNVSISSVIQDAGQCMNDKDKDPTSRSARDDEHRSKSSEDEDSQSQRQVPDEDGMPVTTELSCELRSPSAHSTQKDFRRAESDNKTSFECMRAMENDFIVAGNMNGTQDSAVNATSLNETIPAGKRVSYNVIVKHLITTEDGCYSKGQSEGKPDTGTSSDVRNCDVQKVKTEVLSLDLKHVKQALQLELNRIKEFLTPNSSDPVAPDFLECTQTTGSDKQKDPVSSTKERRQLSCGDVHVNSSMQSQNTDNATTVCNKNTSPDEGREDGNSDKNAVQKNNLSVGNTTTSFGNSDTTIQLAMAPVQHNSTDVGVELNCNEQISSQSVMENSRPEVVNTDIDVMLHSIKSENLDFCSTTDCIAEQDVGGSKINELSQDSQNCNEGNIRSTEEEKSIMSDYYSQNDSPKKFKFLKEWWKNIRVSNVVSLSEIKEKGQKHVEGSRNRNEVSTVNEEEEVDITTQMNLNGADANDDSNDSNWDHNCARQSQKSWSAEVDETVNNNKQSSLYVASSNKEPEEALDDESNAMSATNIDAPGVEISGSGKSPQIETTNKHGVEASGCYKAFTFTDCEGKLCEDNVKGSSKTVSEIPENTDNENKELETTSEPKAKTSNDICHADTVTSNQCGIQVVKPACNSDVLSDEQNYAANDMPTLSQSSNGKDSIASVNADYPDSETTNGWSSDSIQLLSSQNESGDITDLEIINRYHVGCLENLNCNRNAQRVSDMLESSKSLQTKKAKISAVEVGGCGKVLQLTNTVSKISEDKLKKASCTTVGGIPESTGNKNNELKATLEPKGMESNDIVHEDKRMAIVKMLKKTIDFDSEKRCRQKSAELRQKVLAAREKDRQLSTQGKSLGNKRNFEVKQQNVHGEILVAHVLHTNDKTSSNSDLSQCDTGDKKRQQLLKTHSNTQKDCDNAGAQKISETQLNDLDNFLIIQESGNIDKVRTSIGVGKNVAACNNDIKSEKRMCDNTDGSKEQHMKKTKYSGQQLNASSTSQGCKDCIVVVYDIGQKLRNMSSQCVKPELKVTARSEECQSNSSKENSDVVGKSFERTIKVVRKSRGRNMTVSGKEVVKNSCDANIFLDKVKRKRLMSEKRSQSVDVKDRCINKEMDTTVQAEVDKCNATQFEKRMHGLPSNQQLKQNTDQINTLKADDDSQNNFTSVSGDKLHDCFSSKHIGRNNSEDFNSELGTQPFSPKDQTQEFSPGLNATLRCDLSRDGDAGPFDKTEQMNEVMQNKTMPSQNACEIDNCSTDAVEKHVCTHNGSIHKTDSLNNATLSDSKDTCVGYIMTKENKGDSVGEGILLSRRNKVVQESSKTSSQPTSQHLDISQDGSRIDSHAIHLDVPKKSTNVKEKIGRKLEDGIESDALSLSMKSDGISLRHIEKISNNKKRVASMMNEKQVRRIQERCVGKKQKYYGEAKLPDKKERTVKVQKEKNVDTRQPDICVSAHGKSLRSNKQDVHVAAHLSEQKLFAECVAEKETSKMLNNCTKETKAKFCKPVSKTHKRIEGDGGKEINSDIKGKQTENVDKKEETSEVASIEQVAVDEQKLKDREPRKQLIIRADTRSNIGQLNNDKGYINPSDNKNTVHDTVPCSMSSTKLDKIQSTDVIECDIAVDKTEIDLSQGSEEYKDHNEKDINRTMTPENSFEEAFDKFNLKPLKKSSRKRKLFSDIQLRELNTNIDSKTDSQNNKVLNVSSDLTLVPWSEKVQNFDEVQSSMKQPKISDMPLVVSNISTERDKEFCVQEASSENQMSGNLSGSKITGKTRPNSLLVCKLNNANPSSERRQICGALVQEKSSTYGGYRFVKLSNRVRSDIREENCHSSQENAECPSSEGDRSESPNQSQSLLSGGGAKQRRKASDLKQNHDFSLPSYQPPASSTVQEQVKENNSDSAEKMDCDSQGKDGSVIIISSGESTQTVTPAGLYWKRYFAAVKVDFGTESK